MATDKNNMFRGHSTKPGGIFHYLYNRFNAVSMKIVRIILLAMAMALFLVNFWAIDYQQLWGKDSQWAYLRIGAAFVIVIVVLRMVKRDIRNKKQ